MTAPLKKFRIRWVATQEMYADIEAESEEQARNLYDKNPDSVFNKGKTSGDWDWQHDLEMLELLNLGSTGD